MSSNPWYKRYPSDFIAGTLGMTLEEKGAYGIVLDLIYDRGRPIPDDPRYIAGVCGCSVRKWNAIRERLVELGKIVCRDGLISNARAEKEIENAAKIARKLAENGAKGGEKSGEIRREAGKNKELVEAGLKHRARNQKPEARYNPQTPLKGAPHDQPDLIAEQIPPPQPKAPEYPEEFQRLWEVYPRRSGSNDKRKALKAWTARLRAGHSPGEILAGVERYARWCEATGKVGTEMVKQAATFLGPADPPHFAEAWDVPGAKAPPPDSAPAAEQPIWADALREATRRRDMKAANELERLLRASDFTAATARAREYFRERTAA